MWMGLSKMNAKNLWWWIVAKMPIKSKDYICRPVCLHQLLFIIIIIVIYQLLLLLLFLLRRERLQPLPPGIKVGMMWLRLQSMVIDIVLKTRFYSDNTCILLGQGCRCGDGGGFTLIRQHWTWICPKKLAYPAKKRLETAWIRPWSWPLFFLSSCGLEGWFVPIAQGSLGVRMRAWHLQQ